jgi:hypothetical protein
MRIANTLLICSWVILSGCSSPPTPLQPKWNKPGIDINTTPKQWSKNGLILPSDKFEGHWSKTIIFHADVIYSPYVSYLIAHSERVVVNASTGKNYFDAKSWLRKNGYFGLINFKQNINNCLLCDKTVIEFYR